MCQASSESVWWVVFADGCRQGIDFKHRRTDYNDICLELTANIEEDTPGWAVDGSLQTDWLRFTWPTRKPLLLLYKPLRAMVQANREQWQALFPTKVIENQGYYGQWHSECLILPTLFTCLQLQQYLCPTSERGVEPDVA